MNSTTALTDSAQEVFNQERLAALADLELLEERLTEHELEYATLKGGIDAFRVRYVHAVGDLYAELDRLRWQIADWLARAAPDSEEAQQKAEKARGQADDSWQEVNGVRGKNERFAPSNALKAAFRRAARLIHPDRTPNADEATRQRLTELMQELNTAYQCADVKRISEIVCAYESEIQLEGGHISHQHDLAALASKIVKFKNRLREVRQAINALLDSELCRLKLDIESREATGENPLEDLAESIRAQIECAKSELDALHSAQKDPNTQFERIQDRFAIDVGIENTVSTNILTRKRCEAPTSGNAPLGKKSVPQTHERDLTYQKDDVLVFFDFETSGFKPEDGCRVIEVGAAKVINGVVVETFTSLIDSGIDVSPKIFEVTGICGSMLNGAPSPAQVMPILHNFMDRAVIVAHNAKFDHKFLQAEFNRLKLVAPMELLCTMKLARRVIPGLRSYSLASLSNHLGLSVNSNAHRALPDTLQTVALWQSLVSRLLDQIGLDHIPVALMLELQSVSVGRVQSLFQKWRQFPSGRTSGRPIDQKCWMAAVETGAAV